MLDGVQAAKAGTIMQRTRGRAEVVLAAAPGGARLTNLHQSGSAKAMLPRIHASRPEVVFLNTAGGLTGGDHMRFGLTLAPGASATATTQTAERAYAAGGGVARLDIEMRVGAGGALDWLPQETILFEHSALTRRTTVALAGDARLLMVEMVVLGRTAMGETLHHAALHDSRHVTRDGRPVLIEPLRLTADTLARRDATAGLRGARAFATLALVAPGAEDALTPLRGALPADGCEAAASAWDGKCVARFISTEAAPLRRALARAITTLRGGPLPRVWQI
ncbi:urease accessory protein UreD [Actibacterium sp. D379-3]